MSKEQNVIDFYVLCNKLKNIVRTGWKDWGVTRDRVESIAEHIYGVQMLAIAIWSEYKYDLDINKVITMLAIHELEETIIGDLTQFQIGSKTKADLGHKAIQKILSPLKQGDSIAKLILEFDERKTPEAYFAYQCDKLECDLQCKLYDEENCVDLNNQDNNKTASNDDVKKLLETNATWSEMWLTFGQQKYPYDPNFLNLSNFAMKNKINKPSSNIK
ncbi:MAG: HD domain-containing protein [Clostridia bacterium]|nr:HD domain-containing protein [Clostridia bacterium]